ncbi:HNH endonuclease [Bacillus sp. JJ722]
MYWLSNGGEDTIGNTVPLCPNCHKKWYVNTKLDKNYKVCCLNSTGVK